VLRPAGLPPHPLHDERAIQQGPRAKATGNDKNVGRRRRLKSVIWHHPQAVARRHRVGIEESIVRQRVGDAEDFERPGEIEHFDLVENEDGDVQAHGGQSECESEK
jgi:hypothetical protein